MIPEIKQIIRSVDMTACNRVARQTLGMNSERQIAGFLRSTAREKFPEVF
jgi:hypothetical protein